MKEADVKIKNVGVKVRLGLEEDRFMFPFLRRKLDTDYVTYL